MKLRGGEVEDPPRNAGAAQVEKLPCDAERWARTGGTKPAAASVTSATTKRRFMGLSLRLILKVRLKIMALYGVVVRCFSRRRVHWKSKDC